MLNVKTDRPRPIMLKSKSNWKLSPMADVRIYFASFNVAHFMCQPRARKTENSTSLTFANCKTTQNIGWIYLYISVGANFVCDVNVEPFAYAIRMHFSNDSNVLFLTVYSFCFCFFCHVILHLQSIETTNHIFGK